MIIKQKKYNNPKRLLFKRFGFTLAEILLTVVLIGVVAIMTIPAMKSNWQEKTFAEKNKKVVLNIENAFSGYITHSGKENLLKANLTTLNEVTNLFTNEYLYSKDCGKNPVNNDCFVSKYKTGNSVAYYPNNNNQCLKLKDSSVICLSEFKTSSGYGNVFIDINGKDKPNTLDKDVYIYYYDVDGILHKEPPVETVKIEKNLIGNNPNLVICSPARKNWCEVLHRGKLGDPPLCECTDMQEITHDCDFENTGKIWDETEGECVSTCDEETQEWNVEHQRCILKCPVGQEYDFETGKCEDKCQGDYQVFNPSTLACECESGYRGLTLTDGSLTCIAELTLTCPDGTEGVRDLATGQLTCLGDVVITEYLEPCPYGQYWFNGNGGWQCQVLNGNHMVARIQCESNGLLYDETGRTCSGSTTNIRVPVE